MSSGSEQPAKTQPGGANKAAARRVFATTSWSMVLQAADPEHPTAAREALAALCEAYWFPLYSYIRRKGNDPDESADLTQAFFAEVLEKHRIERADQQRGRFRTFLLAALNHFMANQWRERQTLKRGGGRTDVSIDEIEFDFDDANRKYSNLAFHELTAERIFERNWAMTLLAQTLENVQRQYEEAGKAVLFDELKATLAGGEKVAYDEIAARLNMKSGAIKVAVHRLRQRYGEQLRMQIARTIDDPDEVDDELKALFAAIRS